LRVSLPIFLLEKKQADLCQRVGVSLLRERNPPPSGLIRCPTAEDNIVFAGVAHDRVIAGATYLDLHHALFPSDLRSVSMIRKRREPGVVAM
jgi:hypothetical protein